MKVNLKDINNKFDKLSFKQASGAVTAVKPNK